MTDAVEVSVIIPAFNAGPWIGEQLQALAAQVDAPTLEVLVCDNGSTDGTASAVGGFDAPFPLRVVDASEARGASHARNVGAVAAQGEVLAFCDADDLVGEHWARALTEAVRSAPDLIAAGALHHERFNSGEVLHAYGIGPDPEVARPGAQPLERPRGFAGYLPTVAGGNFAIRRQDYLRIRGMDSSYPGGSEETDFAWRAQDQGMRVVGVPAAVVDYRLKSGARALFRQQRIQQRGRMLLWVRFAGQMDGPSTKASVLAIVSQMRHLPAAAGSRARRLEMARVVGGHVGALEGMARYRLLSRVPARALMADNRDRGRARG